MIDVYNRCGKWATRRQGCGYCEGSEDYDFTNGEYFDNDGNGDGDKHDDDDEEDDE
jgi:hypothetical protein